MKARVRAFLDERTNLSRLLERAFDEQVAGGASWARVFGASLALFFAAEAVTGVLLALTYAPTIKDAWSSVFFLQHRAMFGWFLRGMHAAIANAMLLVLALHFLQVVIYGAYKRPREFTWWFGLALAGLVVLMVISGYRLPWDQRTYWALKVEVNITQSMPVVGDALSRLILGGADIGQRTLTRIYAAHVVILPAAMVLLLVAKRALVRFHGRTPLPSTAVAPAEAYFPGQLARNFGFAFVVLAGLAVWVWTTGGEPLDAPAEPDRFYPARPEWFLLPLYKLRMLVPPEIEVLVTAVLPAVLGGALFMLPFVDRLPGGSLRARLPIIVVAVLGVAGAAGLTLWTQQADAHDKKLAKDLREADRRAKRAKELAIHGVPPDGPVAMLSRDPLTRGRDVYRQYCTSCHVLDGEGKRKSPDHDGFGSRTWILGSLKDPEHDKFFGKVKHEESMPSQNKLGEPALKAVTEFMYALGNEKHDAKVNAALAEEGRAVFEKKCMKCHVFGDEGDDLGTGGPNLTDWGSRTWIYRQVRNPASSLTYGELHKMPEFADQLSDHDLWMVSGFLRSQRYRGN
jgi:ubiquinol-cytochrome c reductase cytochrome b subunit